MKTMPFAPPKSFVGVHQPSLRQPHKLTKTTNRNRPQSTTSAETKTGQFEKNKQAKNHDEAKTTTRNATLLHQSKKKSFLASKLQQDIFARPMLTYSYPIDGDVAPGLSTRRSSGYTNGKIDTYANQRVGTKPLTPQFIIANCGKDGTWIAELAAKDNTNTMHEISVVIQATW